MSIITYTRKAKCKDCNFLKYYYKGKRKYHKCTKKDIDRCKDDYVCPEFIIDGESGYWNLIGKPDKL